MMLRPFAVAVIKGTGSAGGDPAGPTGSARAAQARFAVAGLQGEFVLPSHPMNGICLVSLNGVLQHDYVCAGNAVSIAPPAQTGDEVMITWWFYA
jgi:hypothetical protein